MEIHIIKLRNVSENDSRSSPIKIFFLFFFIYINIISGLYMSKTYPSAEQEKDSLFVKRRYKCCDGELDK